MTCQKDESYGAMTISFPTLTQVLILQSLAIQVPQVRGDGMVVGVVLMFVSRHILLYPTKNTFHLVLNKNMLNAEGAFFLLQEL